MAEDNLTNQKLLLTLLKRLNLGNMEGCPPLNVSIDIANDGLQALQSWRLNKHHLIVRLYPHPFEFWFHAAPPQVLMLPSFCPYQLMDLQMPNMDGLTATRMILEECSESEKPQVSVQV